MPGLVPGIHAFKRVPKKDVDGRDKPGHDDVDGSSPETIGIRITIVIAPAVWSLCPLIAGP
jgi:hypothetical protein